MKKSIFLLLLVFSLVSATDDYNLVYSLPFIGSAKFCTTDKLGNAYVIVGNQLLKFSQTGKPLSNFSEITLGELRSVDVSNPMKILLFYPDFSRLIILNNRLSPTSTVNLQSLDINQPLAVCSSENFGYWIYDRQDDKLKKLDLNLQVVNESPNLTQALGFQLQPKSMAESGGMVYISDPENGLLVFDQFGTYYKTLHYPEIRNFQLIEKDILFVRSNKLFRYNSKTAMENEVLLPAHDSILSARIEQQQLYLLTTASLNFYSF